MAYSRLTKRVFEDTTPFTGLTHNLSFATDAEVNAALIRRYRLYNWLTPSVTANRAMLEDVAFRWKDYINQLYDTTQYEYDPISNYDRHYEGVVIDAHHKGTKVSNNVDMKTGNNVDSTVSNNVDSKMATESDKTTTVTPTVKETTTNTGYGFDSTATGVPVGKSEHQYNSGNTQTKEAGTESKNYDHVTADAEDNYTHTEADEESNYSHTSGNAANNYTTTTDIDASTFDKDERSFDNYREYGNIGVTTTQQMIEAERKIIIDVLDVYCDKFAECFDICSFIAFGGFEPEVP